MDVIKDNPQWWALEILDGFGAHLSNVESLRKRFASKILTLKEEGDSSHVNQAYDKHVAKSDKRIQRLTLGMMRTEKQWCSNIMNQWDLMQCGMAAVRYTARHPEIWESSFEAVNLHPFKQLSFKDWCKKIEPHMQAADGFDLVTQSDNNLDEYTLLPAL